MSGIFKAYDVRGLYPEQLDENTARKIGQAFVALLKKPSPRIIVGRDMRSHSIPLRDALVEGLRAAGATVVDIGLVTTPMNYFAVGSWGADGGVQVTASHNPARYNGLKFSLSEARPVSGDDGIPALEQRVKTGDLPVAATPGGLESADVTDEYRRHVMAHLNQSPGRKRLKVVVDAANGMGVIHKDLLASMGIELIPLYFELDGTFPNHEANPLKLENLRDLCAKVIETSADLGVSFDGDADRAAFVDEKGEPIGSDLATALIAGELLIEEPGKTVVYDLRSSRAVAEWIEEKGGKPVRERVGHSFIKATLRSTGGIFGGELAGHYYFRDNYYADSAVMAVIEILNLIWKEGRSFSEIVAPLQRYAKSPEINFEVEDKVGKMKELEVRYGDAEIDHMDGVTFQYPTWWANVRPSNTEPYLRLVVEAETAEELATRQAEIISVLGEPV